MSDKNYGRVYELQLPKPAKLNFKQLQHAFESAYKSGSPYTTSSGVIYVKDVQDMSNCFVVLFGKDNADASNYKRDKKVGKSFQKINIDESKEVLADFTHVAISKTKRLDGYSVIAEKNRMFRFGSLYNLFFYVLGTSEYFELGRRVVSDYVKEINNAKRVLEIKQIDNEPDMPNIPGYHNEDDKTFTVQSTFEIKAIPRGSIGKKLVNRFIPTFSKKDGVKTIVTIVNKAGMKISLDFDEPECETGLLVELPLNTKTEKVQTMIAEKMDLLIIQDNQGKL
ncbi:hypothetical protein LPW11_16495 [Geomonas sp. RF6]|uniref:hypothetical protein n=1 Tax=Geomonas sp. RF6 TaxID=2897342 RepID=UPI001E31B57F|nr:hypothetical protein [Geomonas sp. RF6]UFS69487.1 hypothetical protein LPW11_16495 [Geomonas sp. RF6]